MTDDADDQRPPPDGGDARRSGSGPDRVLTGIVGSAITGAGSARATWSYSDFFLVGDVMPELISREELLELLRQSGKDVAERTLRSWEASGMLPRPVRRWHESETRPGVHAMYPWWATFMVSLAKLLRDRGHSPDETRREIERVIPHLVTGYYKGARDVAIGHRLAPALNDGLASVPWPKGSTPTIVEIRIWDQNGDELHVQKLTIPEGKTVTDDGTP